MGLASISNTLDPHCNRTPGRTNTAVTTEPLNPTAVTVRLGDHDKFAAADADRSRVVASADIYVTEPALPDAVEVGYLARGKVTIATQRATAMAETVKIHDTTG